MTVIGVETSPLRAAREWRGISLVAAARASGLGVAKSEALEDGDSTAFASIEEMIAAAALYGASLGIGRDEAMALLDRSIEGAEGEAPAGTVLPVSSGTGSTEDFSVAVRARSVEREIAAVLTTPSIKVDVTELAPPALFDNMPLPAAVSVADAAGLTGELPEMPQPPADDRSASERELNSSVASALQLDPEYRAVWEQTSSELESWAAAREQGLPFGGGVVGSIAPVAARLLGAQRAERVVAPITRAEIATRRSARSFREWLRRSQHATLIVAIGVGIILIALLIAIASAIDSESPAPDAKKSSNAPVLIAPGSPAPATDAPQATKKAPAAKAVTVKKRPPMLAARKVHLQVLNAGGRKGYARQISDGLLARGYKIDAVGNSKTGYGSSVILYPRALQREAARLSRETSITTMDMLPATGARNSIIVVVM